MSSYRSKCVLVMLYFFLTEQIFMFIESVKMNVLLAHIRCCNNISTVICDNRYNVFRYIATKFDNKRADFCDKIHSKSLYFKCLKSNLSD